MALATQRTARNGTRVTATLLEMPLKIVLGSFEHYSTCVRFTSPMTGIGSANLLSMEPMTRICNGSDTASRPHSDLASTRPIVGDVQHANVLSSHLPQQSPPQSSIKHHFFLNTSMFAASTILKPSPSRNNNATSSSMMRSRPRT